jgi:glyoxylase-like metal-dependent hydrolase (beta-lactamase superfamily II)
MKHLRSLAHIVLLLVIGAHCGASSAGGVFDVELVPLGRDVYLIRRPDPLRQPVEGNSIVIVNESDVVVIDSGGAPASAANALRLIRGVTSKPVSVLINTHWHGDHNMGNQVYREAFPGLRIVSHEATHGHIAGETMSYVATLPAELDGYIKEFEAMAAKEPLSERRQLMLEDLRVAKREVEQVRITPPDLTFSDKLTLHHGKREIQVLHLGKGNTDGDAVVWLPQEKILISGDLVVHPLPYGIGSYPREWLATLDKLSRFPFELLVPGHGEPQKDRAYLQQLTRTLTNIREQVAASVAKGLDLEATTKALDVSSFEPQFTGDDRVRKMLFTAWWLNPIVRSAWLEARGEPIVQSGKSDNR